ncbi:hypothetical protein EV426DRAFT_582379 [Tirmania nivea]|nr:hypothetical protein EV426DRAFT_582379 [Tirmania nivea]
MPPSKSCDSARAVAPGTISEAAVTHLLLSVGFACPFLLPSFFVQRNAKGMKYRRPDSLGLQQKHHKTHSASGVEIWRCAEQETREATLDVAPSNTQTELGSLIASGITHLTRGIITTPQLHHSIQFHEKSNIPRRFFSSTAFSSARSPLRISGDHTTSGRFTAVRSNGGGQHSKQPPSTKTPRDDYRSKVGQLRPSPAKVSKPSLKSNIGTSSKSSTPADASVTFSGHSSISRPSITRSSSRKTKLKPKWVKAGISRTKVKPTGRKARRTINKRNSRESDVKCNVIFESLKTKPSPIPHLDMEAYETAVLEGGNSWKKLLESIMPPPRATKAKTVGWGIDQAASKGVNSKKQKRQEKQTVVKAEELREAEGEVAPGVGSRISVRGDGRIERTVGKGRKVLGTSPITTDLPIENKRSFGTWVGRSMDDKYQKSGEEEGGAETTGEGAKFGGSDKPVEVKNTLPEDSGIPKSQCLQAEKSPIIEDLQQIQAPLRSDLQSSTPESKLQKADPPSARYPGGRAKRLRSKLSILEDSQKSISFGSRPLSLPVIAPLPSSTVLPEQQSKLLARILSSPYIDKWFKSKPEFWLEILKEWYLPLHVNCLPRPPWVSKATIGGKVKQTIAASIFSFKYPPPILHEKHAKSGASPIDVIELLEESRRNGIDILVELARQGEYSAIRWLVRRILHPQIEDVHELEEGGVGDVLGSFSWANENKPRKTNVYVTGENSVAQAGGIVSNDLVSEFKPVTKGSDTELMNIGLARQGLGLVLGSIGTMLVYAEPPTFTAYGKSPFFAQSHSMKNEYSTSHHTKAKKNKDYTNLLPITKEILAYLHNSSLVSSNLYSPIPNPRLSILKSRILTSLADAVWRHQELATSEVVKKEMKGDDANQAFVVPDLGWRLHGYWQGGFETLIGDYPQWWKFWESASSKGEAFRMAKKNMEKVLRLEEMATRGEREVLLELVLRACILAGYGHAGSLVLSHIIAQGGWSWIDYAATWPEEYRLEDLALREESESTDGLPGQWGVRGYAMVPPPVRTIPKTLPRELVPDMAAAIIDSTAEAKGLRQVLSDLDRLGTILGRDKVGLPSLIPRVVSLWETEYTPPGDNPRIGELVLHFIQRWSGIEEIFPGGVAPGEASAELQVWYKVLLSFIDLENIQGAERVWGKMEERLRLLMPQNFTPRALKHDTITHYFHPPWVLASYLTLLNQNRKIKLGLSLLSPKQPASFPVIPKQYYHLPPLTPPLIALATLSKSTNLLNEILSLLPFKKPFGVPHTTLTSILNAYLRIGDFASSQEVIAYIRAQGLSLDGVDVAVLIENTLRQDKEEGYRFVEQTIEKGLQDDYLQHIPPNLRVQSEWGNWQLPFRAAAGKGSHNFTIFEGQYITVKSASKPRTVPPPKMSPSGWLSVLNHAIEGNDRNRAEWALKGLGIDLHKWNSLSTKVFNILLKGVVMRSGARQGWNMVMEHCIRDRKIGKPRLIGIDDEPQGTWVRRTGRGREWQWVHGGKDMFGVRADVITFNTVLDEAIREKALIAKEDKLEWQRYWENGGWEGEDSIILQGSNLLKLLDAGMNGNTNAEELQLWKEGMEDRKRRRQEMEQLMRLCRECLGSIGGL